MLRAHGIGLIIALWPFIILAQNPSTDDKTSEPAKPKTSLDKIKVPPGGVVVVVDDIKEAMGMHLPK